MDIPVFACDFTVIRTAARTDPTVLLLKKGTIVNKFSSRQLNNVVQCHSLIEITNVLKYIFKKLFYGVLVLAGVVVMVFVLFQGFGDPARLVMGQTGDTATRANIRRELYLDQPKWKQFFLYLNDVSPISIHSKDEIEKKELKVFLLGVTRKSGFKLPYLRKSTRPEKPVGTILMEAFPEH